MNYLQPGEEVLRKKEKRSQLAEICSRAAQDQVISPRGKTPEQSMPAALHVELNESPKTPKKSL